MDLPNPCRAPAQNFDYGGQRNSPRRRYGKSGPTKGNKGFWTCRKPRHHNRRFEEKQKAKFKYIASSASHAADTSPARNGDSMPEFAIDWSSRQYRFDMYTKRRGNEVFRIRDAKPIIADRSLCGREKNLKFIPACFNLCCQTIYSKSYFCRSAIACM